MPYFYMQTRVIGKNEIKKLKETRTLLITNISSEDDYKRLKEKLEGTGKVKETYGILENTSILFVIFFDLRHAKKIKESLHEQKIGSSILKVYYTISKYEIPREGDTCDDTKNQGTLLIISRDLKVPLTDEEIYQLFSPFGEIKELREYKPFQKFIEYWDSRCTINAYRKFGEQKYKEGVILLRYLWDSNTKMRWDIIRETDNLLQNLKKEEIEEPVKRLKVEKKIDKNKNVFMRAMDDFLIENLDLISKKYINK